MVKKGGFILKIRNEWRKGVLIIGKQGFGENIEY